jgi:multidrug efflux pump subunit AcrB
LWQGEKRGGGGEPVDKPALIEAMQAALERNVPGNSYGFTQPIDLRVQELVAGVRSDVGLSLYGDDLAVLKDEGDKIVRALNGVPGAADVQARQIAGLRYVRVIVRRDKLARYGINATALLDAVSVIGGQGGVRRAVWHRRDERRRARRSRLIRGHGAVRTGAAGQAGSQDRSTRLTSCSSARSSLRKCHWPGYPSTTTE